MRAKDGAARRYESRKTAGVCTRCGRHQASAGRLCVSCWYAAVASRATGSASNAAMLRTLWIRQQGRCALTGLDLVPGDGASVDHIIPVSRGGAAADADNLRWTLTYANAAKGDLLDDDFLRLCRFVLDGPMARRSALREMGHPTD